MNDNEELNDSAVLSAVRASISGVPLPAAPRLEAITARGRARRRRHLGALSVAGTGACAALVAGLAGGWGSTGPASQHDAPPVHLAAFSVVAGPGDATTLTLYPGQVADANAVRQALAAHGIPAPVTAGKFCYGDPAVTAEARQVVTMPTVVPQGTGVPPTGPSWPAETIVIHGSAITSGDELSIGYRPGTQNGTQTREISFTVIQAGAPLTCTSIPG